MAEERSEGHGKSGFRTSFVVGLGLGALLALALATTPWASYGQATPAAPDQNSPPNAISAMEGFGGGPSDWLLQVPVTTLFPGKTPPGPPVTNPMANDPQAAQRGQQDFLQFNCVGCHAPNGGGAMGPALSNHQWIYGSSPQNIYLTIFQGRPNGMPAWGGMLPDSIIWDLVAYIRSLGQAPDTEWGETVSPHGFTIEQVPAEELQAVNPWAHIEKFSYGQAPAQHGVPAPPLGNGQ
ncbi:MAG TPA: c-type cytochrome [Devosia sp.]|nr:c-type cytochrome [Devosia sp.]